MLACAGDVPTLETLAAAAILRERLPELQVRVVNVVDLMRLSPRASTRTACPTREFDALFTTARPVIFAYHGYPWLIHRLTYRRTNHHNIHVRGYKEEGTTTTPFDMVMLNDLDRFHLVMDVIDRVPGLAERAAHLRQEMVDERLRHRAYTREHGDDPPDVTRLDLAAREPSTARALARARARRQRRLEQPQADAARRATTRRSPRASSTRRERAARRRASSRRRSRSASARPTRSATGSSTAASASARRCGSTPTSSATLRELIELAPLHQPQVARGARRGQRARCRTLPAVACFDTAFHATLPPAARTYALPAAWRERWGLRRYGFHGLSHAWVARRAPRAARARPATGCGSSAATSAPAPRCARSRDGRSVDTTMGFTPLEGLVMATRSGSVDPGLLLWLLEHERARRARAGRRARARVGPARASPARADMREVARRAPARARPARELALDVYLHRLRGGDRGDGGGARRARRARLHRRRRRALARPCARDAGDGLGFLGVDLDRSRNTARGRRRDRRRRRGRRDAVLTRERTPRSRAWSERCSAASEEHRPTTARSEASRPRSLASPEVQVAVMKPPM